ncbi:tRNA (guanine-N1)-methyltransferase [Lusitaniella coriacea]|uniref:tRNA (guanine-N1)-methyltransferase n=1 Tax=Lusitaniella coriacea TaxID=1983105 RepID=UPI001D158DC0|nr:tRNA (guanine-N1)-methyltransferase [Lusitaniella coriacea]
MNQREGQVEFTVGTAFYNRESKLARDLGVLAASVYRRETGSLRVLDAMAGCGVRALRYWRESEADWVWANEGNPEVGEIVGLNLQSAIASGCAKVTHQDANRVFFECYQHKDYYDLVDVDSFGSPMPYLSTALWATKIGGLLYLTSTDGRTATGHLPQGSLKVYGAFARAHPAAHEQGLRLMLGAVQQCAAQKGLGIEPVFSLFSGQIYRVMVRLRAKPALTERNYGFLGYCHGCGEYRVVGWRKLGREICACCGRALTLSGPMWLGSLHNRAELEKMQTLAQNPKILQFLDLFRAEADLPPYFYTLGEIGRRGKIDVPARSRILEALRDRGYRATPTHINAQALKTDAPLKTCLEVARLCSST